jgi:hypothetical protein
MRTRRDFTAQLTTYRVRLPQIKKLGHLARAFILKNASIQLAA